MMFKGKSSKSQESDTEITKQNNTKYTNKFGLNLNLDTKLNTKREMLTNSNNIQMELISPMEIKKTQKDWVKKKE